MIFLELSNVFLCVHTQVRANSQLLLSDAASGQNMAEGVLASG